MSDTQWLIAILGVALMIALTSAFKAWCAYRVRVAEQAARMQTERLAHQRLRLMHGAIAHHSAAQ